MSGSGENEDIVTRLIGYCLQDQQRAKDLFDTLIMKKREEVELPEGVIHLTEEQTAEFAERYSAEVEPTLWESKRRKF